jgi:hypothetical protein
VSEEINKKVIDIFSKHSKSLPATEPVKFYAGFNYVKLTSDTNGKNFNEEHLRAYSEKCHYIVSVMRKFDGQVMLYNYDVPHKDLSKFLKSFEENTLDGEIIEIEKYVPEGLA